MEILKKHKEILLILILSAAVVLSAGLTSDLYLGDEVYHYRFAKDIYTAGKRVAFDPLYPSGNPPGYFYLTEPLWNGLLAMVWKVTGGISFYVAQVYHCFYYLLLIFLTYLLGIKIYGKKEGIYAALLISSVPMVVSFSILFYMDVPGTVFAALSLLLLFNKQYFLTGLGICLMYFTKRNACFLIPCFLFILLVLEKEKMLIKLKNLAFLLLPMGILGFMDLQWRRVQIESGKYVVSNLGEFPTIDTWYYLKTRLSNRMWGSGEYLNSSLINPTDIIQYFGVALLVALVLYLFSKKMKERSWPLWVFIFGNFIVFAYFFGINSDIRYLLPIVFLFCLLASSALQRVEHLKWFKISIWAVCFIQLLVTSLYVHQRRLMPLGMKEGFSFIKENTPANALFMYPGYIFVEATSRKFIWSSFFLVENCVIGKKYPKYDFITDKSAYLFWTKNEEDIKEIIELNKLDYIVVDKSKIYDDTKVKHFGGYPKSFIERLPNLPVFKKIYEDQMMTIWEVQKEALIPLS